MLGAIPKIYIFFKDAKIIFVDTEKYIYKDIHRFLFYFIES